MSQITITLNQIQAHSPCAPGWEKVLKANGGPNSDFDKPFPVSSILISNDLRDILWTLRCLPKYDLLWRKFSWWCASQVVHNTTDHRVKDCLDTVHRFINGGASVGELYRAAKSTKSARAPAESAAWSAAWSAARSAAPCASESVQSAARSMIWSVQSAARSKAESAGSSWSLTTSEVRSAVRSAESDQKIKLKQILELGGWVD